MKAMKSNQKSEPTFFILKARNKVKNFETYQTYDVRLHCKKKEKKMHKTWKRNRIQFGVTVSI